MKPVHRFDLVVLAVEPGSGRRRGWLSNIHLGARDPEGGFVMVGKTFKGMTDQMLRWQTERFGELATDRKAHVVELRPVQVVEIAVDGVQRSTRYREGWRCGSPGWCATAATSLPRRPTPSPRSAASYPTRGRADAPGREHFS